MKIIPVVAAVIKRDNLVLLTNRPEAKPPYGWEFPGGKVNPTEDFKTALRRELMEELGIHAIPLYLLHRVISRQSSSREIHLYFIRTELPDNAQIIPKEGQEFRWVKLSGPPPQGLLSPDRPVWNFLANLSQV